MNSNIMHSLKKDIPLNWKSLILAVITLWILFFFTQRFVIVSAKIRGDSMAPMFTEGQIRFASGFTYLFRNIRRGDVVALKWPENPSVTCIKRVIGLPNETVLLKNGKVIIIEPGSRQEKFLNEPYVDSKNTSSENGKYHIASDELFVMGDNRTASDDSRIWGPVPRRSVTGYVF